MTDLRQSPWETAERASRRRALWVLSALAVAAVLLVVCMVAFLHVSPGAPSAGPSVIFQQPTPSAPGGTAAPPSAPPASSTAAPTTATSSPPPSGPPCPGPTACAVPGDAGNALAAVNAFRASHGAAQVPGTVSSEAAQCALTQGDGGTCQPHYAWETLAVQDGNQVVAAIGERDAAWLLDPGMSSFSVGWAFDPGSNQWSCAVLKIG